VSEEEIPVGWGDQRLPLHSYVAFYFSDQATIRQGVAFIRSGLEEPGTLCLLFGDERRHPELLEELQKSYDGDVEAARASGKLLLVGLIQDFELMAEFMVPALRQAAALGYQRIRALGLVSWAWEGSPPVGWLKQCESLVRHTVAELPMVAVCMYQLPGLASQLVLESGLEAEPVVFVHDRLVSGTPPDVEG
jgi:hypothetical protein